MHYLETPEESVAMLLNLDKHFEDAWVSHNIKELKSLPNEMPVMTQAWKNGDLKTFETKYLKPMKKFKDVHKVMLVDRNKNWVKTIDKMARTKPIEFFLVGSLHLVGPHSVQALLKKKGYKIERVK